MGTPGGFADVLQAKLGDVPPSLACPPAAPHIVSPPWVHRLEPLPVTLADAVRQCYSRGATAAPRTGQPTPSSSHSGSRSGSQAAFLPAPRRSARERMAVSMLNRLGATLDGQASDGDIRAAYCALVRRSHPDRHPDASPTERRALEADLRAVVSAWQVFQDRPAAAAA